MELSVVRKPWSSSSDLSFLRLHCSRYDWQHSSASCSDLASTRLCAVDSAVDIAFEIRHECS